MKRNTLKLAICWTVYFLLATQTLVAQNLSDEMVLKAATPFIENKVVDGISIGYIQDEKHGTVHLGTSGNSADAEKETANNDTLYEIGSISKVFTSLLLADAVVRGEIELDAEASTNNRANIKLPSYKGRSIKWIDLSTHRSGLPRLPSNMDATSLVNPYEHYDSEKAAAALADLELSRSPNESQEYSNFAVSILGYLVGENTDKSYQELLRERIAKPLSMMDCTTTPSANQKKRHSTPHARVGSPTSIWTFADMPGAGGVRATMNDMMQFAKAQLNPPEGKLAEAIELAWKQHAGADASGPAMGLGWVIMDDGTRWHNGQTGGSHSMMLINRKSKLAIIVLCNTAVIHLDSLAIQLMKVATGETPEDSIAKPVISTPKLSPFTEVQFIDQQIIVTYEKQKYQWLELDKVKVKDIISAAKKKYGDRWQKRVSEDLVDILWSMEHRPDGTVELRLRNLKTSEETQVQKAPMTEENRFAVYWNRQHAEKEAAENARHPNELSDDALSDLTIDSQLRARLVGKYELAPTFIFDVKDRDGRLMVGITNQPTLEVFPDSANRWSYRSVDATLEFKLTPSGPAKRLVLHQNGIRQYATLIEE